ncbi:WG repeat-containing protein [Pantanalinema sp. GBBB05]|uniref:WG repeat-containing protein n=1 Tax=Pantanalinema sp. GBBB05 TaxID=2604139 RepID=UPI001D66DD88|nr:WG repeat-containing protein [Pantanalinema sp. GBBB05]
MIISLQRTAISFCLTLFMALPGCAQADQSSITCNEQDTTSIQSQNNQPRLFAIAQQGKWGFISRDGKVVIQPNFSSYKDFAEGLAAIKNENGRAGYIDTSGKLVIAPQFEDADAFHEQRAGIRLNGKWGFIDQTGKIVVAPQFEYVGWFSEGRAAVRRNNLWGFIDLNGTFIVQPKFIDHLAFSEGLAGFAIRENGKYRTGLIDRDGNVAIELKGMDLTFTDGFSNGLIPVEKEEVNIFDPSSKRTVMGFLDRSGRIAIPLKYDYVSGFEHCLAPIQLDGKWGVIDVKGKIVIAPQYDDKFRFSEGLAAVQVGQKYGFIDRTGKMRIQPRFAYAFDFRDGLASVLEREGGKWGFIDHNGKIAIPLKLDEQPSGFFNGLSTIRMGSKRGYINKKGHYVWTPTK